VLTGVGLVVALVTGCSATGPEPNPSPTPAVESSEPSATPTPDASPAPVRPPEMDSADEAGAVAAAGYFLELFSYALRSGDLAEWNRVSADGCAFCASVGDDVKAVYGSGGSYTGGALTVDRVELVNFDENLGGYAIGIEYAMGTGEELDGSGAGIRDIAAERHYGIVDVLYAPGGWLLVGFSIDDERLS
jgi:hypothetical protein